jgi:hypothetical protein
MQRTKSWLGRAVERAGVCEAVAWSIIGSPLRRPWSSAANADCCARSIAGFDQAVAFIVSVAGRLQHILYARPVRPSSERVAPAQRRGMARGNSVHWGAPAFRFAPRCREMPPDSDSWRARGAGAQMRDWR